jgi:outer membrane protein TolC
VEAAEALKKAARGEGLPSLAVNGDYGAIGNDVPGARATFTLGASLKVPVFAGGRVSAKVHEAEAHLAQERARLEDLKARIYYEVQNVFLDLKAASDRVQVAESTLSLAREQLRQARDRFEAGVADNLEVVQAQQTLADAEESRIASLYAYNAAKFSLAHALGGAEASYAEILKGH